MQKKAAVLAAIAAELAVHNVDVRSERAEDLGRGADRDRFGLAVCRALAPPPIAVELCLPLVRPGGRLVIWAGETDAGAVERAALELAGELELIEPAPGDRRSFVVVRKTGATPDRFPRRAGMAAKRPLTG